MSSILYPPGFGGIPPEKRGLKSVEKRGPLLICAPCALKKENNDVPISIRMCEARCDGCGRTTMVYTVMARPLGADHIEHAEREVDGDLTTQGSAIAEYDAKMIKDYQERTKRNV